MQFSTASAQNVASIQRAVRSAWQDLKRHRTEWQELTDDGLGVANKLVNLVLQQNYTQRKTTWGPALSEFHGLRESLEEKLKADMVQLTKELRSILEKLSQHMQKMQVLYLRLDVLLDDTVNNLGEKHAYEAPVFRTRPLESHVMLFRQAIDMYTMELSLKRRISEVMPDVEQRGEAMFHLSAWLHQPYLDEESLAEIDDIWSEETSVEVR